MVSEMGGGLGRWFEIKGLSRTIVLVVLGAFFLVSGVLIWFTGDGLFRWDESDGIRGVVWGGVQVFAGLLLVGVGLRR